MTRRRPLPDLGLEWLLPRTEPVGKCLEWTGYCHAGGRPMCTVNGETWYVQRLVWALVHGCRPRRTSYVLASCDNPLCVHPDCLVQRTRSQAMSGKPISLAHRLALARAQQKNSRLTEADVLAIRASDEPGVVLDARYGLSQGYAQQIRMHKAWRGVADPFAGLRASIPRGAAA